MCFMKLLFDHYVSYIKRSHDEKCLKKNAFFAFNYYTYRGPCETAELEKMKETTALVRFGPDKNICLLSDGCSKKLH